MKRIIQLFLLSIVSLYFVSCETDFNVIADYKEVAIVYGLLNQQDTIHYLRINKAFLGSGNALTYASIADSSTYGDNINVYLYEFAIRENGDTLKRTITFEPVTLSNKDSGAFYYPNQVFYTSDKSLYDSCTYKLIIINKKTGNEVSSITNLIHNFHFIQPAHMIPPYTQSSLSFKRSTHTPQKFIWTNAINGKRYQLKLYFNYKELIAPGDTDFVRIEWVFPEQVTGSINGDGNSSVSYVNEDFYTLCENNIPHIDPVAESTVIKRYASTCELQITVVGDEFNTYLDTNGPSTGLLIEKPDYSNITNGLGLFSSRYQINYILPLAADTKLDLSTISNLKFQKPN